jgi:hypothetical protein
MLDKRIFVGGMDFDSDDRLVEQGDYRYALNVMSSKNDKGDNGTLVNAKGDVEIPFDLPAGNNRCIGSYENKATRKVYFWNWNDSGNHGIYEYDVDQSTVTTVMVSSVLNLNLDFKVVHADMVDDLLFWVDGLNHPRMVNVSRAKSGAYPTPLLESYINNIVPQPVMAPVIQYTTDTARKTNNLRGNLFQFKTQYQDVDDRRSAWSTVSKISQPPYADQYDRIQAVIDPSVNNAIDLTIETGSALIRKIRIAVRVGNNADFYLVDTIDKDDPSTWVDGVQPQDNSTYVFRFYNDIAPTAIDITESNKPYDFVPLVAHTQSLLDGQRLGYANIEEGFDNVPLNVFASVFRTERQNVAGLSGQINGIGIKIDGVDQTTGDFPSFTSDTYSNDLTVSSDDALILNSIIGGTNLKTEYYISGAWNEGDVVSVAYTVAVRYGTLNDGAIAYSDKTKTVTLTHIVTAADAANISVLNNSIISQLNSPSVLGQVSQISESGFFNLQSSIASAIPNQFGIGCEINTSVSSILDLSPVRGVQTITGKVTVLRASIAGTQINSYKSGSRHALGIVYYDYAGRYGKVNADSSTEVYVPFATEDDVIGSSVIRLTIGHTPPVWATHYQIVYAGNSQTNRFIHTRIGTVTAQTNNRWKINVNPIIRYNEGYNNVPILSYSFTKGDRIRGVWKTTPTGIQVFDDFIEYEVLGFDESTYEITVSGDSTGAMILTSGNMVEIFTPKKSVEQRFFYETGDVFKIVGGYHQGNLQNQTASQPAILDVNSGDVWVRPRKYNYVVGYSFGSSDIIIEDFSYSDFYTSNYWNRGRANNIDRSFGRVKRPTTAYYTEVFIPETQVNGLSNIFPESFRTYDIRYGDVLRLYSLGDRVVVFQNFRVGQVLVNKEVLYDSTGGQSGAVERLNQVLSQISYFGGEYGITNPESMAIYGKSIYFVDSNRGAVLRIGGDGITRISSSEQAQVDSYKMNTYFVPRLNKLKTGGFCRGVYNRDNEEYILCFSDYETFTQTVVVRPETRPLPARVVPRGVTPSTESVVTTFVNNGGGETISFSEAKNRWVTFYSWVAEWANEAGTGYVSWQNGRLYLHNASQQRNVFRGNPSYSQVTVAFNAQPTDIKFFINQIQEATSVWRNERIYNQFGQESNLIEMDFDEFEGVYKATYMRDANTPNVDFPLINGDSLRCHSLICELVNELETEAKLFAVSCRYANSELNN